MDAEPSDSQLYQAFSQHLALSDVVLTKAQDKVARLLLTTDDESILYFLTHRGNGTSYLLRVLDDFLTVQKTPTL